MDVSYALDHARVPAGDARRVHVLIRLETWPEEGAPKRKPLHLALAIDRSGSMSGPKLWATIEAALELVGRLSADDQLAIVAYGDEVDVLVPPTPVADKSAFRAALEGIQPKGGTNLSGGWCRALGLLAESRTPEALNRVLLLTDGLATRGVTDKAALGEIARQFHEQGIDTSCFGVGEDFSEEQLTAIAAAGGGRFHFIKSADQAGGCFVREFGELTRVCGQSLELTARPGAGAAEIGLLGDAAPAATDGAQTARLGDLLERDQRQVLLAVRLRPALPVGEVEVVVVEVRYDAVRGRVGPRRHLLPVCVTVLEPGAALPAPEPEVARALVLHEVAQARMAAARHLNAGERDEARVEMERARAALERGLALDRAAFAAELEQVGALLSEMNARELASSQRKEIVQQAADHAAGRGSYSLPPQVWSRRWTFLPPDRAPLEDACEEVRMTLEGFGHGADFVRNAEQVLRELAENAVEHGCRGPGAPRVEVEARANRSHFRCVVEDSGPGFDVRRVLDLEEARAAGEPTLRGRGLLLVQRLADAIEFSPAGNRITATLRRDRFRLHEQSFKAATAKGVLPVWLIEVEGTLDNQTSDEFTRRLDDLTDRQHARRIIIDLTRCRYISSLGMSTLIRLADRLERLSGMAVLVSDPRIREMLRLLGIENLCPFAASVREARKLLGEAEPG